MPRAVRLLVAGLGAAIFAAIGVVLTYRAFASSPVNALMAGVGVAALALALLIVRGGRRSAAPAAPPSPASDAAIIARNRARQSWDAEHKGGIVSLTSMDDDGVPLVFVHDDRFMAADDARRAGLADTLNMAALGPGRSMETIRFVGRASDRELARWTRAGGLEMTGDPAP